VMLSAAALKELFEGQLAEADALTSANFRDGFEAQVGLVLATQKKGVKLDELIAEWDKNGDSTMSKAEFRLAIKALMGGKADLKEMDALFDKIDADKSNKLEIAELKKLLKKMQAQASGASGDEESAQGRAERLKRTSTAVRAAYDATADLEANQQLLKDMRVDGAARTSGERLGEIMRHRGTKIGEMVSKWDKDSSGGVSKAEFVIRVKEIGLPDEEPLVVALFESLDTDKSGQLDTEELKRVLANLQQAAIKANEAEKEQEKKVKEMVKVVKSVQKAASEAEEARLAEEAALQAAADAKAGAEAEKVAEKAAAKKAKAAEIEAKSRKAS